MAHFIRLGSWKPSDVNGRVEERAQSIASRRSATYRVELVPLGTEYDLEDFTSEETLLEQQCIETLYE